MKKSIYKTNKLIKRKNLILLLNKEGIKNIGKDSLKQIEDYLINFLKSLTVPLKEQMLTNGRKTLKKEDVINVLKNIKSKDEFKNWEV